MDLYTHRGRETELANFLMKDGYEFQPSHFQARSFAAQDARIYSPDTRSFTIPEASSKNKVNISEDPAVHGTEFDYDDDDMSGWGVMLLYTFVKSTMDGERKVQILVAYTTPIDCVLRFHSSTLPFSPKYCIILTYIGSGRDERHLMGRSLLHVPPGEPRRPHRTARPPFGTKDHLPGLPKVPGPRIYHDQVIRQRRSRIPHQISVDRRRAQLGDSAPRRRLDWTDDCVISIDVEGSSCGHELASPPSQRAFHHLLHLQGIRSPV
jgi:hypothetical protein